MTFVYRALLTKTAPSAYIGHAAARRASVAPHTNGTWLVGESQVDLTKVQLLQPYTLPKTPGSAFEIEDFSFDVEQTLSIGSQSTGGRGGQGHVQPP